jgi:hypothetical protein
MKLLCMASVLESVGMQCSTPSERRWLMTVVLFTVIAEEVCTGPGLARGSGLGLVAHIMFGSGPGLDLVQMKAIKLFFNISGFIGPFLFRKEKVIRSCSHLMLVTQSGSGNKSHWLDFLRDFRSCSTPEIVRDNTLQTWHPISLYRSSNAKITSGVLRASLKNSFKDYWYLCPKGTCINDTIVGSICK